MLRGLFFVVSAASGAGKTTLCSRVVKELDNLDLSISSTTREPRGGETDGVDYDFITRQEFLAKIEAGEFAEWALVHGRYYGTSRSFLFDRLNQGHDVILDIDVQGGEQLRNNVSEGAPICIMIMPPSLEVLKQRLRGRGVDSDEEIEKRLRRAQGELACVRDYAYVIVNHQVDEATMQLKAIIIAERQRLNRYRPPNDIAPFTKLDTM